MGSLLPYFHGARKLPTSALCLILPPIPPVETFPKKQEQVISQAGGVFCIEGSISTRETDSCRVGVCSAAPGCSQPTRVVEVLCSRQLVTTCSLKERVTCSLSSALSEAAHGGHKGRGVLALFRHRAFRRALSSPEGNPTAASVATAVQV